MNTKLQRSSCVRQLQRETKAVIINSPSNPTGMIYSKEELQQLGEVCLEHDILIVPDEIYGN